MTLEEFLAFTQEVAHYPGANKGQMDEGTYLCLGLAGETGEAVDVIKKLMRDGRDGFGTQEEADKFIDELGDVLWYWVRLVWWAGSSPDIVMHRNVTKLKARMQTRERESKSLAPAYPPIKPLKEKE